MHFVRFQMCAPRFVGGGMDLHKSSITLQRHDEMVDFEVQTQRKTQVSFRSLTLEAQTSPSKMVS